MNKFNKGDWVFDLRYGWGKVNNNQSQEDPTYPLLIKFSHQRSIDNTYTEQGRSVHDHQNPVLLTQQEAQAKFPEHPKPITKRKVDGFLVVGVNPISQNSLSTVFIKDKTEAETTKTYWDEHHPHLQSQIIPWTIVVED